MPDTSFNPDPPPAKNRVPRMMIIVLVALVLGLICGHLLRDYLPTRPQLDVRNTGSTSVMLQVDSEKLVIAPGQTGSLRFSQGDKLTIFAGDMESKPVTSVTLEGKGPRVSAEVQTGEDAKATFRYVSP